MLIVEHNSNGRTIVRFHKDWHPSRIGKAYTPTQPMPNYTQGTDALRLQRALIKEWMARNA
jgi:hypothetical protein